mmetsp:Transcript_11272/g.39180  ORF Transcript_11272/g.39180 Transcript_11272/m.39180 type:complete len:356 (-) Transcript_11272:233-1300(-)
MRRRRRRRSGRRLRPARRPRPPPSPPLSSPPGRRLAAAAGAAALGTPLVGLALCAWLERRQPPHEVHPERDEPEGAAQRERGGVRREGYAEYRADEPRPVPDREVPLHDTLRLCGPRERGGLRQRQLCQAHHPLQPRRPARVAHRERHLRPPLRVPVHLHRAEVGRHEPPPPVERPWEERVSVQHPRGAHEPVADAHRHLLRYDVREPAARDVYRLVRHAAAPGAPLRHHPVVHVPTEDDDPGHGAQQRQQPPPRGGPAAPALHREPRDGPHEPHRGVPRGSVVQHLYGRADEVDLRRAAPQLALEPRPLLLPEDVPAAAVRVPEGARVEQEELDAPPRGAKVARREHASARPDL